ncbi:DUF4843 domain-containing protein [Chitinophaga sp. Cy-1792]|uniref:DUF4843 domain-containing protein n=1 Tax=Chitinophaga sp. Cy-1792 TaxID=2608339 RepID=UPI0014226F75|nr:DUF4843 domain-containing protein [Chitinophaga sp. Cy-1792]
MKKIITGLFIIIAGCLFVISCKREDIPAYNSTNDVYFSITSNSIPKDTSFVTFAYTPFTTDTTVNFLIRVTGPASKQDRAFNLQIADTVGNPAKRGIHYDMPSSLVMPAGKLSVYIPIRFYKTKEMATQTYVLDMHLLPNENFTTSLKAAVVDKAQGITKNVLRHVITIDDRLAQPAGWADIYFGKYSKEKILLIGSAVPYDIKAFATANNAYLPVPTCTYLSSFMMRYFKDHAAVGDTIREADGTVMTMGPAASI